MKLGISSYPSADSLGFPTVRIIFCRGLDIRVPQAVDVQVQGQVVLFENQLEPPGESAGVHGQVGTVMAEDIILWGERASLVQLQLPFTEGAVLS